MWRDDGGDDDTPAVGEGGGRSCNGATGRACSTRRHFARKTSAIRNACNCSNVNKRWRRAIRFTETRGAWTMMRAGKGRGLEWGEFGGGDLDGGGWGL